MITNGKEVYDIHLTLCHTKQQQDHWVRHMAEKIWITPEDLADLHVAFEEIFERNFVK